MSSRCKNFRRRANEEEDDIDAPATTTTTTSKSSINSTTAAAAKPNHPIPKLLSFADEDENEISSRQSSKSFTKPSSSFSYHKVISMKDRLTPSSASLLSNVQPQSGTYTKEALHELQKNTKTLASSRPTESLKEVEELDEENEASGLSSSDQATINAIWAKMERLQQLRAVAPDFISIDGGSDHGAAEGLSDEEPGRIAMFGEKESGKNGMFEDVDERGVDASFRRNDNDDDDEDEEKIWEEEQFRKGLWKKMDAGFSTVVNRKRSNVPAEHSLPPSPSIGGTFAMSQGLDMMSMSQQSVIATKSLQENLRKLKESHGRTMTSLTRTEENLSATLVNITDLEKSLSAAGERFIFMQKFRDFVSVVCDFLKHKAPFIEELEEQMQKLHEERASAILERRVADNNDEMMEVEAAVNAATTVLGKGGSTAAMVAAATSAAQAAAASVREEANLPVKLDEFGRDMNLQKRMEMERRAEARKHRKARSDSKRISSMETDNSYQRIEGESSTDESDSESTGYKSNCELLLQTADQIFSDAAEEYSQLSVVKERFDKWKKHYSSSYRDAYMSLSVPAIFSPYVRLELLEWDPLHAQLDFDNMKWTLTSLWNFGSMYNWIVQRLTRTHKSLGDMRIDSLELTRIHKRLGDMRNDSLELTRNLWTHSVLFDYGLTENGFNPDDADASLVPELVEKIALPILHHEISHCWDMLSIKETKNAVSATSLVATYVPDSSEAFRDLLAAIRTRLIDAVTNLMVPTWSPLIMRTVPNASRVTAYRFGTSVRLMRNICLWKEILSMPVLEKLALDELLSAKILPHVRSIKSNVHDAVTRTERIIASLSGLWAGSSVTGQRSHKLQPLVDYVLLLGKTLEEKQVSGVAAEIESESGGLARRLKKMLVELNEYDEARALSRTYHLEEDL